MMKDQSLNINLSGKTAGSAEGSWLNIGQETGNEYSDKANLWDISQMLTRASGGLSAHTYSLDQCQAIVTEDTISFSIDFMVYPSSLDLEYSLAPYVGDEPLPESEATISNGISKKVRKEGSYTIGLSDRIDFDFLIDLISFTWETSCFNALGEQISTPTHTVEENRILFDTDEPFFGVCRVKVDALGYKHTLSLTYDNSAAGIGEIKSAVSVSDITIKAKYDGGLSELASTSETINIPDDVNNCLPQCDDGSLIPGGSTVVRDPDDNEKPVRATVYFSTCDGSVLDVH